MNQVKEFLAQFYSNKEIEMVLNMRFSAFKDQTPYQYSIEHGWEPVLRVFRKMYEDNSDNKSVGAY